MATFKPSNAGLRSYLRGTDYLPALESVAASIEERAKTNSPVESPESAQRHDRAPGRFRDSIHTERHRGPVRNTVRVVADSDAASIIEARDRPLGRAAG